MRPSQAGRMSLEFICPTRGLMGFYTEFLSMTSGTGLFSRLFSHHGACIGQDLATRSRGVMVSMVMGKLSAMRCLIYKER